MLSNWIRSRVPVARATFSSVRVDGERAALRPSVGALARGPGVRPREEHPAAGQPPGALLLSGDKDRL